MGVLLSWFLIGIVCWLVYEFAWCLCRMAARADRVMQEWRTNDPHREEIVWSAVNRRV